MANKLYQESDVQSIANAIRTKNGSSDTYKISQMANAILNIPSGGGTYQSKNVTITQNGSTTVTPDTGYDAMTSVNITTSVPIPAEEKDVNFYDYDGTIVYSYTAQEFANLSAMPANPSHPGLTAQGWNWALANAKTYVSTYGKLDIGQSYVTSDGKTRLYVEVDDYMKHIYVGFGINGSATIDWGDNTTSTVTGSSTSTAVYGEHTYSQAGNYVITIQSNTAISIMSGSSTSGPYIFTGKYNNLNQNKAYFNCVKKIELGSNIGTINQFAFTYMTALETITIPTSVTTLNTNFLYYCSSLKYCVIPNEINALPASTFGLASSLKSVSLPEGCNSFGAGCFRSCYNLEKIIVPSGQSYSLPNYVFYECYNLKEVILPSTTTSIAQYTFGKCNILRNPPTKYLTVLGNYAFQDDISAVGFEFPSGLTKIPQNAFSNCYAAEYFIFKGNISSIGTNAFSYCNSAKIFDFTHCTAVPTLSNTNAFSNTAGSIVVPDSLYTTWVAASNWSNLASRIVKESEWSA